MHHNCDVSVFKSASENAAIPGLWWKFSMAIAIIARNRCTESPGSESETVTDGAEIQKNRVIRDNCYNFGRQNKGIVEGGVRNCNKGGCKRLLAFVRVCSRLLAFSPLRLLAFVSVCLCLFAFVRICLRPPLLPPRPLRDTDNCIGRLKSSLAEEPSEPKPGIARTFSLTNCGRT